MKYVGQEQEALQNKGLNMMDKTLLVGGARISYSIWEVEGMQIFLYFFFLFFLNVNPCFYVSLGFIWLPREHGPQITFLDVRKL